VVERSKGRPKYLHILIANLFCSFLFRHHPALPHDRVALSSTSNRPG